MPGVRAIDIRNPYQPKEVGYFIPAITEATDKRCIKVDGKDRCKTAIQSNNVETDDRGYIYVVDRANTGLHILEVTGEARAVAGMQVGLSTSLPAKRGGCGAKRGRVGFEREAKPHPVREFVERASRRRWRADRVAGGQLTPPPPQTPRDRA